MILKAKLLQFERWTDYGYQLHTARIRRVNRGPGGLVTSVIVHDVADQFGEPVAGVSRVTRRQWTRRPSICGVLSDGRTHAL